MMMNTSKNQFSLSRGTVIRGKWHKQTYIVERELGRGATGTVFLVKGKDGSLALKLSSQLSITSEINVLKAFNKVQGSSLGPYLVDEDDWEAGGQTYPFYVMEYIQGPTLSSFIEKKGASWIGVLLLQLLENLQALHQEGWIFGDIKPDNLLVAGPPFRLRCIDVGGTTKQGRAVKEYTEFFDRGYWGAGSRTADPAYDVFAAAMVAVNLIYPNRFNKDEHGVKGVISRIKQKKEFEPYAPVLIRALEGRYVSAWQMREDLMASLSPGNVRPNSPPLRRNVSAGRIAGRSTIKKQQRIRQRFKAAAAIITITFLYALYVFLELL
ncbi:phosphotransferase [Bacillus sp. REN10]|uniref:protein kinase domain-containing protein n=1 Tax=Bacillus sp. REN10 TaxID=2782541 RepID=UPI00193B4270|nr:phosphotransferase [Bacillus sp. REN10]